jgi:hypothetical protein
MQDLKAKHKCNGSLQELMDGGRPNLVHNTKEKTSMGRQKME